MIDNQICNECGRSVALGSGKFVNRVPDCNKKTGAGILFATHLTYQLRGEKRGKAKKSLQKVA